jgi:alpha-glucosidase
MYFQKIRHPSNFRFARQHTPQGLQFGNGTVAATVRDLGEDVFHVELHDTQRWPLDARAVRMLDGAFAQGPASTHSLGFSASGNLELRSPQGRQVLTGVEGACLGVSGSAWLVQLARHEGMRFYGQGEKTTGLEKTGKRTKFWNTDVWADHAMPSIIEGQADPLYAAVPYLLLRDGAHWVGLLVDHPGAVFMDTGSNWFFFGKDDQNAPPALWFGADQGVPAFYVIAGDSAAGVTQRLQRLVGTTPLPPLWSLGHHQSRWGYAGTRDLHALDAAFSQYQFPNDGLWLDIDYMDNYKVFTTSPEHFGPELKADLAAVQANGRRVVPILDPGVKVEAGYEVAQSGVDADIYCRNPEGQPYVGFVWPGRTWFPDHSLPAGRDWWASYAQAFRASGFDAAWLDMNDPSTGAAELDDMLFQRGQWPHWAYHNQYATGMAHATREGFLRARPDERPFLLARSAAAGSSRYTAVWTGDNFSNWQHLRASIHCSLNLALSGIPFNGPDVPGFGGHADKELAVAWYKAGCLFPFLRNHASAGTAQQEPWAFGPQALDIIRHHVRLRYKLLPYLYQLWVAQARDGAAVMRPLFYDFADADGVELSRVDDQFLIGTALMQAPLLHAGLQQRQVVLPGDPQTERWMDAVSGRFLQAGRIISVTSDAQSTPIYLREGSLLPMQPGERMSQANDLSDVELHVVLGTGAAQQATLDYVADDGLSYAFERGERSRYLLQARREGDGIVLTVTTLLAGWKPLKLRVVAYDGARQLRVVHAGATSSHALSPHAWRMTGATLNGFISPGLTL